MAIIASVGFVRRRIGVRGVANAQRATVSNRCGNGEREQHTRDRCVQSRVEHGQPEQNANKNVRQRAIHTKPVECDQHQHQNRCRQQRCRVDLRRVEQCNDQHGANVIYNRQRCEKHLEPGRHRRTKQRDNAQRKRNVGGHRNAPPCGTTGAARDTPENERRHDHAAQGTNYW